MAWQRAVTVLAAMMVMAASVWVVA